MVGIGSALRSRAIGPVEAFEFYYKAVRVQSILRSLRYFFQQRSTKDLIA
jgi:hypothetical protein